VASELQSIIENWTKASEMLCWSGDAKYGDAW